VVELTQVCFDGTSLDEAQVESATLADDLADMVVRDELMVALKVLLVAQDLQPRNARGSIR